MDPLHFWAVAETLAQQALEQPDKAEGYYRSAISRIYYATFHRVCNYAQSQLGFTLTHSADDHRLFSQTAGLHYPPPTTHHPRRP